MLRTLNVYTSFIDYTKIDENVTKVLNMFNSKFIALEYLGTDQDVSAII